MTFLGADPEALDRLAAAMGRTADGIRASGRDTTRQIEIAGWRGPDADRLRSEWRTRGAPALQRAQAALAGCAKELRSQAAAQRLASGTEGGPGVPPGVVRNSESKTHNLDLSIPARILNVNGGVTAGTTISQDGKGYVATVSGTARPGVSFGGKIKGGKGSKDGKGTTGTGNGEVGSYWEGKETRAYRFDTREEAEKFLAGYEKATIPNKGEIWQAAMPGVLSPALGAGHLALDARRDGDAYLKKFNDRIESHTIESTSNAFSNVDFGVGKFTFTDEQHVGGGGVYDTVSGERTSFVTADVNAGVALGLGEGSGGGEVTAGVTFDRDGIPKSLDLSGALDAQGGFKGVPELDLPSGEKGVTTTFDAQLDLQDPDNRGDAFAYLQAAAAGDSVGAARHLASLLDRADVTVTLQDSTTTGRTPSSASVPPA